MRTILRGMCGLALTSLAVLPSVASAQAATRPVRFGATAGGTLPVGDFGDAADFGFHLGALAEYKFAGSPFGLRVDGQWHRNEIKDQLFEGLDGIDGNASILFGAANLVLEPSISGSTVAPYAIGGLGLYNVKLTLSAEGTDVSQSQTKIGFNVGGGFKFRLSGFDTFVEARFHTVNTEDEETGRTSRTNFIPISFGIIF